jgi:hypothetical protein
MKVLLASFEPRRDRTSTGWRFVQKPTRHASSRQFESQPTETPGRYEPTLNARPNPPSGSSVRSALYGAVRGITGQEARSSNSIRSPGRPSRHHTGGPRWRRWAHLRPAMEVDPGGTRAAADEADSSDAALSRAGHGSRPDSHTRRRGNQFADRLTRRSAGMMRETVSAVV